VAVLALAALVGGWLLSPPWWNRLGADSVVFYSAATLAEGGGDPYDFGALARQERAVYANQPAEARGAFSPAPYSYPPLMTALWRLMLPLGERGFYWTNALLLLAAGMIGARLVMRASGLRRQALPLVAFVVSAPFVLGLVAANPSNLLFLAWAGAFYALTRGRAVACGLLLALTLVVKVPVGLVMAGALLLAWPGALAPGGVALLAGTALMAALNTIVLGPAAMRSWLDHLAGYGATLEAGTGYSQCCLAGLPGLLTGILPVAVATVLTGLAVAAVVAAGTRFRGWWRSLIDDRFTLLAVLVTAGLAVSPYLHLNDLVMLAVPVLFVASHRLGVTGRALLLTWGLGALPALAAGLVLSAVHPGGATPAGFGVMIIALTLAAVLAAVDAISHPAPARSDRGISPG
jgi:hypothetical protein